MTKEQVEFMAKGMAYNCIQKAFSRAGHAVPEQSLVKTQELLDLMTAMFVGGWELGQTDK